MAWLKKGKLAELRARFDGFYQQLEKEHYNGTVGKGVAPFPRSLIIALLDVRWTGYVLALSDLGLITDDEVSMLKKWVDEV